MKIGIVMFPKEKWLDLAEDAHKICFKEVLKKEDLRFDFALGAIDEEEKRMIGYMTAREFDRESVYWQHGGTFPPYEGTLHTARGYEGFIKWCKDVGYKRIGTLIENDNKRMLKLAAHNGFKIVGLRNFQGKVLLEHGLEFEQP